MTDKLLLSYRAVAKLLGVSRGGSLHELISLGLLRPVTLLGRSLIPREQVEALARTGDGTATAPEKLSRRRKLTARRISDLDY